MVGNGKPKTTIHPEFVKNGKTDCSIMIGHNKGLYHNILIYLCTFGSCNAHPLEKCNNLIWPFAKNTWDYNCFVEDLNNWTAICNHVHVWTYITSFAHYLTPFSNLHVLGPNLRFLAEKGVEGIFAEGNRKSIGGDLTHVRNYILSRLLWDPTLDTMALVSEFTYGYYKESAVHMLDYIHFMHDELEKSGLHLGFYDSLPEHEFLTEKTLEEAEAILWLAEQAATSELVRKRVQIARFFTEYKRIYWTKEGDSFFQKQMSGFISDLENAVITVISDFITLEGLMEMARQGVIHEKVTLHLFKQLQQKSSD